MAIKTKKSVVKEQAESESLVVGSVEPSQYNSFVWTEPIEKRAGFVKRIAQESYVKAFDGTSHKSATAIAMNAVAGARKLAELLGVEE